MVFWAELFLSLKNKTMWTRIEISKLNNNYEKTEYLIKKILKSLTLFVVILKKQENPVRDYISHLTRLNPEEPQPTGESDQVYVWSEIRLSERIEP